MTGDRTEESVPELGVVPWRKSGFSAAHECVVFAELGLRVAVRNSNDSALRTTFISRSEMASWVSGCKAGEFDDLTS